LLALPQYVNAPIECFEASLLGRMDLNNNPIHSLHGLNIFHRYRANDPTTSKAAWITGRLYEFLRWDARPAALDTVFDRVAFLSARRRTGPAVMTEDTVAETGKRMRRVMA